MTPALRIEPVAGRIGAIIEGVRLYGDIDDATATAVRAALLRHKVIFFRDQHDLGDTAMEGFAERMGEPIAHPNVADPEGSRYLLNLEASAGYAASIWHTDMTFLPAYPAASILRAVELPEAGGDTMWANCAAAYNDLPEPLKAMADRLRAIHSNETDFEADFSGEVLDKVRVYAGRPPQIVFHTEHPVVRVHPETGERVLLTGTFLRKLVGFDQRQSQQIVALLHEYITRPENCVRWRWRKGDVAMWDNRATQHRSVADFGEAERHLRRATIHGSVPVGVDGAPSRVLKGPPAAAAA